MKKIILILLILMISCSNDYRGLDVNTAFDYNINDSEGHIANRTHNATWYEDGCNYTFEFPGRLYVNCVNNSPRTPSGWLKIGFKKIKG